MREMEISQKKKIMFKEVFSFRLGLGQECKFSGRNKCTLTQTKMLIT
jgi:hypothetical protein